MLMNDLVDGLLADNAVATRFKRKDVKALASAVLAHVRACTDGIDEGRVAIPVLGVFVIKPVVREKDGQAVTTKRILLKPRSRRAANAGA
jgi:hypothetical protein